MAPQSLASTSRGDDTTRVPIACGNRPHVWGVSRHRLGLVPRPVMMVRPFRTGNAWCAHESSWRSGKHCRRRAPSIGLDFQQMAARVVEIDSFPLPPRPERHPWATPVVHRVRTIAIRHACRLKTAKGRVEFVSLHRKGIVPSLRGYRQTDDELDSV